MSTVADSATRIQEHTAQSVNDRIRHQTQANIAYYAANPEQIDRRLRELDQEWDTERWLQINSAALTLFGLTMAALRGRQWLVLPLIVQGFFLQHGVQGYCPPLPFFRRGGVRTEGEIQAERTALLALRGDLRDASGEKAMETIQR